MGILLAAEVAQRITSVNILEFVDRTVFQPLEMKHSAMGLGRFKREDIVVNQGFRQELDGSRFHRLDRRGNVAIPGDEHNRNVVVRVGHLALQVESAQARQLQIEHQATRRTRPRVCQKLARRRKQLHLPSSGPHQTSQRLPHGRVVVHDKDDRLRLRHTRFSWVRHMVNWKVAPGPSLGTAQSRPP